MPAIATTVRLPTDLFRAAQVLAADDGDVNTVIIRALEEYLTRARGGPRPGKYKALVKHLGMSVTDLHLSARAAACLRLLNIRYVYELVEKAPIDLRKMRNFGEKSLREVQGKLAALDLALGMTLDRTSYAEALTAAVVASIKAAKG